MHHLGTEVTDLARSEAFYVDLLGFTRVGSCELPAIGRRLVFLDLDGVCVELLCAPGNTAYVAAPASQAGLKHLALETTDLRGDVERLRAAGVTIIEEPTDIPAVSAAIAFVADPDGLPVELWQNL
jgi:glyoxylase I family protein